MAATIIRLPHVNPLLRVSRSLRIVGMVVALALAIAVVSMGSRPAAAAEGPVGLGTAGSFAVLAGSTVTNTGPSVLTGDLGVSPGTAITGFPPGLVNGATHSADAVALQAQSDLVTAYNDTASRATSVTVSADLGGQTLVSGVYTGSLLALTGTVTLDAKGDPNAVFIFQSSSTLITASSSVVSLVNGADACNVYWQVGSSATLGTASTFVGTVMALTSITANTGATVQGRLLARNGAVTLDSNVITRSECSAPTSSTTTAASTTTASTTTATTQPTTTQPTTTQPTTTQPTTTQPTTTQPTTTQPTTTVGTMTTTVGTMTTTVGTTTTSGATTTSATTAVVVPTTTAPTDTTTVPTPKPGAPDTGGVGSVNPLNSLIAFALVLVALGLGLSLRTTKTTLS